MNQHELLRRIADLVSWKEATKQHLDALEKCNYLRVQEIAELRQQIEALQAKRGPGRPPKGESQ